MELRYTPNGAIFNNLGKFWLICAEILIVARVS